MHRLTTLAETLPNYTIDHKRLGFGDVLFQEDTYARGVYYVEKGTILLKTSHQTGSEIVISVIGANNFIGYLPVMQKTRYTSTAVALQEDCQIKFIPKNLFLEALQDPNFNDGFMRILCQLIRSYETEGLQLKTKNVREKLATTLLSLDHAFKKSAKDANPVITLKKKDLATLIGIVPETLSRTLADFDKEGLIALYYKGIQVKDKKQLIAISKGVHLG